MTTSLTFTAVVVLGALWSPICWMAWKADFTNENENKDKENKHDDTHTDQD
jgi:hypothetical protein